MKESRTVAVALIGLGIGVVILVFGPHGELQRTLPLVLFRALRPHLHRRHGLAVEGWGFHRAADLFEISGVEVFTYPPAALFLFWPLVWIPVNDVPFLWTLLTLLCLSATLVCAYCYLRPTRGLLVIAGALWAVPLCVVLFRRSIRVLPKDRRERSWCSFSRRTSSAFEERAAGYSWGSLRR